jgi:hypothetical protein
MSIISLFYYALVLFNNNAICVQVLQFLSATATGNIIAVLLPLLALSVKFVCDKIDAAQLETKMELQIQSRETKKELQIQWRETKMELQSRSRLITQILTSLAKMETNIAWMRGDHGVANFKHRQSDQRTKSLTESGGG